MAHTLAHGPHDGAEAWQVKTMPLSWKAKAMIAHLREDVAQHRLRSAPLLPGLGRTPLAVPGVHRGLLEGPPVLRALRRGAEVLDETKSGEDSAT